MSCYSLVCFGVQAHDPVCFVGPKPSKIPRRLVTRRSSVKIVAVEAENCCLVAGGHYIALEVMLPDLELLFTKDSVRFQKDTVAGPN